MPETTESNLETITLSYLRQQCAEQSERFFNHQSHNPSYCFELFRRAVIERNQSAWKYIFKQYEPLVSSWVQRHSLFASAGEEQAYFVNRAFEKMWSVLSPEKFANFPDLKSILRYLQLCVHSALVDYVRSSEEASFLEDLKDSPAMSTPLEDRVVQRDEADRLWSLLLERLNDEKERRVVYGSFVLGLKPSELCNHYSKEFEDVQEVYRVKENVLARLRRDEEIHEFLESF